MPDLSALAPNRLFDLDAFAHRALFDGTTYAWEALPRLAEHLERLLDGATLARPDDFPGAHLEGKVLVGAGTTIEPGAFVRGPAVIGDECEIRAHAYLRGKVLVGDRCVIGSSELKGTILMNDAHAAHFNYCGDAILGHRTNLGAGTKLANLRFDGRSVGVALDGERIDTGLRKLASVLGDDAQTGCNSVLNPGTVLARGAVVPPTANVGGFVPARGG